MARGMILHRAAAALTRTRLQPSWMQVDKLKIFDRMHENKQHLIVDVHERLPFVSEQRKGGLEPQKLYIVKASSGAISVCPALGLGD